MTNEQPRPASLDAINSSTKTTYIADYYKEEEYQVLFKLPCKHNFSDTSFLSWLKTYHDCPIHRYKLHYSCSKLFHLFHFSKLHYICNNTHTITINTF